MAMAPYITDEGNEADLAHVWPFRFFRDPRDPLSDAARDTDCPAPAAAVSSFHAVGDTDA